MKLIESHASARHLGHTCGMTSLKAYGYFIILHSHYFSSFSQEHMVDWIVRNVLSSISAEQEEENLNACIANLEALAAKQ